MSSSLLISPAEFHAARETSSRRIVPVAAGRAELLASYQQEHIPGSIFFNMDIIVDTTSPYPQMLPTAGHFAKCMGELGVRPDDVLVVYDTADVGMYSAPRVAWACRFFGHESVHVLNNFRLYVQQGYPVSHGKLASLPGPTVYPVREPAKEQVVDFDELKDIIIHGGMEYQIVDARIPGRFSGVQAEADPSLRSGHMPSAINIPLAAMLDPTTKTFLPLLELKDLFGSAGVHDQKPFILTCNSGVTAAALDLALQETGFRMPRRIYDGSWMEWTRRASPELVATDSV
ncbi:thiosulfate sulfurtransferase [Aspergillus terreus]|uniref:Thiosulfate sulfurtransferase n=1 Tax=Aspergillus terreus TaxID=33178 RepID=A0A5M3YTD5_ASPTE|nr:hypothetical protein ATETN484_0004002800 [Aspergillus terreus]GFF12918.1 thiosulfate sulfurtransferase [Aspergillus terreus]